jgi:hypothetical protein
LLGTKRLGCCWYPEVCISLIISEHFTVAVFISRHAPP